MNYANYIMRVLRSRIFVMMSWGFEKPSAIENGLRFNVTGYLHTGVVEVIYQEGPDAFDVKLINEDGSIKNEIKTVYVEALVDTIDSLVERTENYKEQVEETYKLK